MKPAVIKLDGYAREARISLTFVDGFSSSKDWLLGIELRNSGKQVIPSDVNWKYSQVKNTSYVYVEDIDPVNRFTPNKVISKNTFDEILITLIPWSKAALTHSLKDQIQEIRYAINKLQIDGEKVSSNAHSLGTYFLKEYP